MTEQVMIYETSQPTVAREYGVAYLRERYKMLVQAAREVLREDVDYGVIPGTEKPTLLKPGAEKLTTLFGLRPVFTLLDKVEDWDNGFFYYRYRCSLLNRSGEEVGNAEGSANSKEKRYRWRYIPAFKASEDDKARAVRTEKRRSKRGNEYEVLVVENDDPYTLVNTLQKIAQKRAFVAAVLIATGASEFFTQDLEDIEFEPDTPPAPEPTTRPQPKQRSPQGNGSQDVPWKTTPRPWPADVTIAAIRYTAQQLEKRGDTGPSTGIWGVTVKILEYMGDRHTFTKAVFGVESTKDLTPAQKSALVQYVQPEKDAEGTWLPKRDLLPIIQAEFSAVVERHKSAVTPEQAQDDLFGE